MLARPCDLHGLRAAASARVRSRRKLRRLLMAAVARSIRRGRFHSNLRCGSRRRRPPAGFIAVAARRT
jgi:hypothetical protein